jgi:hypothetical protein
LGLALRAVIVSDDAVLFLKGGTLRLKHGVVHQQAVGEDDGLRAAAGLFVEEVDAVDADGGHFVFNPERCEGTLL